MATVLRSTASTNFKDVEMEPRHINIYLPAMDPLEAEKDPIPSFQRLPIIDSALRCIFYWLKY